MRSFKYYEAVTSEGSSERLRLFVAIAIPDAVREEMARVQDELQPLVSHEAVRWTKLEQFHLTLRFLGDFPSDHVSDLQESVRGVCSSTAPLHLRAQGVGFFPNARSPRVIWVGANGDDNRLMDLQKKIEDAVRTFTVQKGGEYFAGHVTLGRFKQFNRLEIRKLTACAETMKDRTFGEWTARGIEIVQSELSPTGARHTLLAALPLGEN